MTNLRKAAEQARAALANARDYIYLLETGDVSWSEESQLQEIQAAILALKKALAAPERKPLTDTQLEKMAETHVTDYYFDTLTYARAIERAHGIGEQHE